MDGIAELVARIDREKVGRARQMSAAEKFLAGAELFEEACAVTMQGIRNEHPGIGEEEALVELKRRLALGARLEERLGMARR